MRLALVSLLYLFILVVVLVIWRSLVEVAPASQPATSVDSGRLVVVDSGESQLLVGRTLMLQPTSSIGRNPGNTIILDDSFVSGEHAMLTFHHRQWWLEDLGSTNGTFLNGQRVQRSTPLAYGDVVQIGRVKLKLAQ